MFCNKCGSKVLEGTKFCFQCGNPLNVQSPAEPVVAPVCVAEPETVVQPEFVAEPETVVQPEFVAEPETVVQPEFVAAPQFHPVSPIQPNTKPVQPEKKAKFRLNPPLSVRILLRIASVLLSIFLVFSLIATAFLINIQRLTNPQQIGRILDSVLTEDSTQAENSQGDSEDTLSPDQVISMVFDSMKESGGSDMTVTLNQVNEFLDRTDAVDVLSDKLIGFVEDFIYGTRKTTLKKSEILNLLDENKIIVEDVFEVKLDDTIRNEVSAFMDKNDIESMLFDEVFVEIEETELADGVTVGNILGILRFLTSGSTLAILIMIDILLIGLLLLTHWLRIDATLRTAGIATMVAGLVLVIPTLVLQNIPSMMEADGELIAAVIQTLVSIISPVHYTILLLGVAMFTGFVVMKILAKRAKA